MFDPTGKGSISIEQYLTALASLGVDNPTVPVVRIDVHLNSLKLTDNYRSHRRAQ